MSPGVGGLHPDVVVHFVLDSILGQRLQDGLHRGEYGQVLVRHQTDVTGAEVLQVLQENRRHANRTANNRQAHKRFALYVTTTSTTTRRANVFKTQ